MGNQIFWCYAEQEGDEQNRTYENKNLNIKAVVQEDVSLQNQEKKKYIFFQQESNQAQIQSNNLDSQCAFCISYLKSTDNKLKKQQKNCNNNQHPMHHEDFKELHYQLEPLVQIHNDSISKIVSTWFQLAIALPKFVKSHEITQEISDNEDLQTLICLKWGVVDFFKLAVLNIPKDKIIRECFEIFKRILHYCLFFNEIFLENYSQTDYQANISFYIKCYQYYQRLMYGYANQYEQLIDKMQQIYQQQFSFKNENNQYPNFKVIGYMMRFWCQVMLTDRIQKILEVSFQNLNQLKDSTLFYQYVIYALDVNINEDNVHWIGHRENFKYDKKLLSDKHWQNMKININLDNENYHTQLIDKLAQQKIFYPSWYYEVEIEYDVIRSNIKMIVEELKQIKRRFYYSEEFEDQVQLESLIKSSNNIFEQKESPQSLQNYIKQFLNNNDIIECCDSLDSIEKLDKIKTRLSDSSNMSTEISTSVNLSKIVENMEKLISDLILIKKKLKQREFILQLRASKWKLKTKREIEWLYYFNKTSFIKIPDSRQNLQEYILEILHKLKFMNNGYYQNQIQMFY
ncbi:unnamed protein product (macronuclear) [Paramecium tetraurelia]|uniref:Uncharacterized protein n=1 Tax=Paramecium tetraurelia TaxID=5888 RepID=A0BBQ7_PARTE|nr:uncharacterized protein GSPATT00000409001 [Paramecium tetraurelia]CAK55974.1 unnamed protein product [Paramecium tetraurelia]|eukprot:XP_001423372.1 hypothetical protein (macronuclear) [Paramecium tetraurelia strain d4-2]